MIGILILISLQKTKIRQRRSRFRLTVTRNFLCFSSNFFYSINSILCESAFDKYIKNGNQTLHRKKNKITTAIFYDVHNTAEIASLFK